MSKKYALIIGNSRYNDPGLAQLTTPGRDAADFASVLKDKDICSFDKVDILLNGSSSAISEAIDVFFEQKNSDDLLLLYFSGHGVRDDQGSLYLAATNTVRTRLRSTAIKSDFIREAMDQCPTRRQVLILDCCNSGAFTQGTKGSTGLSVGTATAFEGGFGRIILTASDATQYAWEGDKVIGGTENSLFTHFLVKGLKGEADNDGNGFITVDELYDYAFEQVKLATPKQTPSKFSSKQQGEIILRQNIRLEDIKPIPLPAPLLETLDNPFSEIRMASVKQLAKIMDGKNLGMARSAMEKLEYISKNDDSRTVSRAAFEVLEARNHKEKSGVGESKPIHTPNPAPITDQTAEGNQIDGLIKKIKSIFGTQKLRRSMSPNIILTLISILSVVSLFIALLFLTRVVTTDTPSPVVTSRVSSIILSDAMDNLNHIPLFREGQDVYSHLDLNSVPAGTEFRAMWYYKINVFGGQIYLLVNTRKYTPQDGEDNIYFSMNDPIFHGTYRAESYMGDQLVGVMYFTYR